MLRQVQYFIDFMKKKKTLVMVIIDKKKKLYARGTPKIYKKKKNRFMWGFLPVVYDFCV